MINESSYPVEHWTNRLGISLDQRDNGFVITTFLSETDAAALMAFDGWNPSSQALNRFRDGILCKITYGFKNPEHNSPAEIDSLEQLREEVDRLEEKSCEELIFESKGMAYVSLLPLYSAFEEKWEREHYEKNKHLVGELGNSQIFNKARCYLASRNWRHTDSFIYSFYNGCRPDLIYEGHQIFIQIRGKENKLEFNFWDEGMKSKTQSFTIEENEWSHFQNFVTVMEQINNWQRGDVAI